MSTSAHARELGARQRERSGGVGCQAGLPGGRAGAWQAGPAVTWARATGRTEVLTEEPWGAGEQRGGAGGAGALTCTGRKATRSPDTPGTGAAGSLRHTRTRYSDTGRVHCTRSPRHSGSPWWTSRTGTRSPHSGPCNGTCHSCRRPGLQDRGQDSAPPLRLSPPARPDLPVPRSTAPLARVTLSVHSTAIPPPTPHPHHAYRLPRRPARHSARS